MRTKYKTVLFLSLALSPARLIFDSPLAHFFFFFFIATPLPAKRRAYTHGKPRERSLNYGRCLQSCAKIEREREREEEEKMSKSPVDIDT